jgi:hypothetical protein
MNLNALKLKLSVPIFLVLLVLATGGCAWLPQAPHSGQSAPIVAPAPIVTPDYSLAAKVISVNTVGRFVVLSFPASPLPKEEQTLFLYRNGLKVAEVRVTGPQQDNNTVADITSGEAQVGDAVRDQ